MSYIALPANSALHSARKLILRLGFVLAGILALLYFSGIAEAIIIYQNNNTYTKTTPDSAVYYTAFTDSFTPSIQVNNVTFNYDVKGYNTATVKVRVYINGAMVTDSTHSGLSNNVWAAQSVSITNVWNPGTTYNLEVKYTRGNYYAGGYSVSLRGFTINDPTPPDSTPPTGTYSPSGGMHFQNASLNIGATYTDPSGITYTRHCSGTSTCDPGTANVSTFANGSTFFALWPLNTYTYLCTRARDGAGNWSGIHCNSYNRRLAIPTNISASANGNSVTVQWMDNSNEETGYKVYKSSNGGSSWTILTTTGAKAGASSYNYTESTNGTYIYKVAVFVTGVDEVESYNSNQVIIADTVAPKVLSINAGTPTRLAPVINFTASDTGGTGISYYQVWRTTAANYPDGWSNVSGNVTSASWTDNAAGAGVWWYGLHVVDGAGNCITEGGQHCGGVQGDSLDPRTAVPPVQVVRDTTPPNTPAFSPPQGTYACSASNPLVPIAYSTDTGNPISPPVFVHYALNGNANCGTTTTPFPITTSGTVNAMACDQAGNTSQLSANYVCNTAPPSITLGSTTPAVNSWTNSNITIPVTANDPDRVSFMRWCVTSGTTCTPVTTFGTCNGTTTSCSGTVTYNSSQGLLRFCFDARDVPGNTSNIQCSGPYGRDTVNPSTPVLTGPTVTSDTTPSINVSGTDALSGIDRFVANYYRPDATNCGTATTYANPGSFTMPATCYSPGGVGGNQEGYNNFFKHPLVWLRSFFFKPAQAQTGGDGQYRFYVIAYDKAGNPAANNFYVQIDTTPPPVPTVNDFGVYSPQLDMNVVNLSNQNSINLRGTCSGWSVLLHINGVWTVSILCGEGWNYTLDMSYLPDGYVIVAAYDQDQAGNYSIGYNYALKDTVRPTTPGSVMCPNSPTNQPMLMQWVASSDVNGINYYSVQPYSCPDVSCGGKLTTLGGFGIMGTYASQDWTDGNYTFNVTALDNAGNSSIISANAATCVSDRTPPNPTVVSPCVPDGPPNVTTCSPTNDTTPHVHMTSGSDPVVNGASSGNTCNNVGFYGPQGSCGGVCLAPGSTDIDLPLGCYQGQIGKLDKPAGFFAGLWEKVVSYVLAAQWPPPQSGGDGIYSFLFETQDAAGNISTSTRHTVEIDTTPLSLADLYINVDPRPDAYPLLGSRNYTATASGDPPASWETNSNWPLVELNCATCSFVTTDPTITWDPQGIAPPQTRLCSQIAVLYPNMQCTTICGPADPYAACFKVYFNNNPGVGHNGTLTLPIVNIFKDEAGNPAQSGEQVIVNIDNQPPAINVK